MKHYYPKSQQLQVGAVLISGLCVLAIRQTFGLDWESGGPALVFLLALGVAGYLTSGKRVDVDVTGGQVLSVWCLVGVPLWQSRLEIAAEAVELRPEWMHWLQAQSGAAQKALVYDLVLVGRGGKPGEPTRDLTVDLKEDQALFTLAERRARAVAEELNLPVAVRWDRLFEDTPCESREHGDWRRPFAYPQEMKDWRKWVSW